jgi:hypothetical protein
MISKLAGMSLSASVVAGVVVTPAQKVERRTFALAHPDVAAMVLAITPPTRHKKQINLF